MEDIRALENHDVAVMYCNRGRGMTGRLLLAEGDWVVMGIGASDVQKRIAASTVDNVAHMVKTCRKCHGGRVDG